MQRVILEQMVTFSQNDEQQAHYLELYQIVTQQNARVVENKINKLIPFMPMEFYDEQKTKFENGVLFDALVSQNKNMEQWFQQAENCKNQVVFLQYIENQAAGCEHYISNLKMRCSICKDTSSCKYCHNDLHEDHLFQLQSVICNFCGNEQRPSPYCTQCGKELCNYVCEKCALCCFNSPEINPVFHCEHCNRCEIGLQHLKKHCEVCNKCFTTHRFDGHQCVQHFDPCPVCRDELDQSRDGRVQLPCGHSLHRTCRKQLLLTQNVRCPICRQLILQGPARAAFEQMYTQKYLEEILPPIWNDAFVWAQCNQCGCKFLAQQHPIGFRCVNPTCLSFNTSQLETFGGPLELANEVILEQNNKLVENQIEPIFAIKNDMGFYQKYFVLKFNADIQQQIQQNEQPFECFLRLVGLSNKPQETQLIGLNYLLRCYCEGMKADMAQAMLYHGGIV